MAKTFPKFYSELSKSLFNNLLNSPNKFNMNYVLQYYKTIELKYNFNLTLTTEKKVLDALQCIDISKVAEFYKIFGKR